MFIDDVFPSQPWSAETRRLFLRGSSYKVRLQRERLSPGAALAGEEGVSPGLVNCIGFAVINRPPLADPFQFLCLRTNKIT